MKFCGLLLASILLVGLPSFCEANLMNVKANNASQQDINGGMQYFNSAYEAYFSAKNSASMAEAGNFYAQAIADAAKANTVEPENISYIALSMQIYRGKGVLPYAKSAFLRAEKLLQDRLDLKPDDVGALLDYAILCKAGDMAYRPEQAEYHLKSQRLAQKVCSLLISDSSAEACCAKAIANLILGNENQFLRLLKASDQGNHDLIINRFYLTLYENTVEQDTWLWLVAEKYLQNEFLLYYLCDLSRPYKL